MKATICITLKAGLLDVQGKTVKSALESLGFKQITDVRIGRYIELELSGSNAASAKGDAERMCKRLLANPVVETYHIEIAEGRRLKAEGRSAKTRRWPPASALRPPAKVR